jgi:hypothetical protein
MCGGTKGERCNLITSEMFAHYLKKKRLTSGKGGTLEGQKYLRIMSLSVLWTSGVLKTLPLSGHFGLGHKSCERQVWFMPVILALGRLRQEDNKFEAFLGYLMRPRLKKKKKNSL